jgi:hypothetical protein
LRVEVWNVGGRESTRVIGVWCDPSGANPASPGAPSGHEERPGAHAPASQQAPVTLTNDLLKKLYCLLRAGRFGQPDTIGGKQSQYREKSAWIVRRGNTYDLVRWPGKATDSDSWPSNQPIPTGTVAQGHTHYFRNPEPSTPGNSSVRGQSDYQAAQTISAALNTNAPVFVVTTNAIWMITKDPLSNTNPVQVAGKDWWKALGKVKC